jgi:hypothetical protein
MVFFAGKEVSMLHRLSLLVVLLTFPLFANAWPPGGVPVCTDPASQITPQIAKLTDGFAVVWTDVRRGNNDIFAQKLDGLGSRLWTLNGNPVCDHDSAQWNPIVIDGANGGALFFFEDPRNQYPPWPYRDVWGQRFYRNGTDGWVHNGKMFTSGEASDGPAAISDGFGGAFLAIVGHAQPDGSWLYGFHIDSLGSILWQGRIDQETYFGTLPPQLISDGVGGVIVGWFENHRTLGSCILGQRLTLSGQPFWDSAGVSLVEFSSPPNYGAHTIVSESSHGVIGSWSEKRSSNLDIFAQRVSGGGSVRWQTNGIPVRAASGDQANPKAVPDGAGGAILVWEDGASGLRDIYAQRVDSTGARLWDTLGVPVIRSTGDQTGIQVVSDDAGGVIVTWKDNRNGNNDIYAQRLNPNGQRLWDTLGVQICVWNGEQTVSVICPDGSGGAVIAWQDTRNGNNDIYAQRVTASGSGVWEESQGSFQPSTSDLSFSVVPNPFNSFSTLPGHERERFALYDIAGRKVGIYRGDRVGADVPPGVYFLRPLCQGGSPLRVVKVR